jgi:hypothetical protein
MYVASDEATLTRFMKFLAEEEGPGAVKAFNKGVADFIASDPKAQAEVAAGIARRKQLKKEEEKEAGTKERSKRRVVRRFWRTCPVCLCLGRRRRTNAGVTCS